MKEIKRSIKSDNGEMILESMIVYSVTIFLLFFILAIFSVLFQRWNIQTVANEAATRVAQTYRLSKADEVTGYISTTDIKAVREYRYIWDSTELKDDVKNKIMHYAGWRLAQTTYTKNVIEPQFNVEVIHDALGRRHIKVTISGEYAVPFGEALSYFGFEGTTKYEAIAYADCVDIIDYINTVDYVKQQTSLGQFGSGTIELIDKVLKLFNNIFTK